MCLCVSKKATKGVDCFCAVDLTVVYRPMAEGPSWGCEFESLCAIEGSSRGKTDKMARCRCWTGTLKNSTKCILRWELDCWSTFFFRPPAHLCTVTLKYSWMWLLLKLTWTVIYYCRWQPYFFIYPLSIAGYWLGECHGWFHLHGLPQATRSWSENYKMNKICPQRESNSRPLDCEATTVTVRPWYLIHYRQVKTKPGFSCAIYIYIITRGRCFVAYTVLYTYNICINWGLSNIYNSILVQTTNPIFLSHFPTLIRKWKTFSFQSGSLIGKPLFRDWILLFN